MITFAEMELMVKNTARFVENLRTGLAKLDDRVGALEQQRVIRLHDCGPGKMFIPDNEAPRADPDAPVECPNCGAEMEWDNYSNRFCCPTVSIDCGVWAIEFYSKIEEAEAAAIVQRMAYHPERKSQT